MRKRLPPLNALRTFEAAARNGSFKHAAEELCVSHSAVSHQIKQLERHLGVELFVRKARSVELTKKGRDYYPVLRGAFDRIAEGTDRIFKPDIPGILTVQSYSTFAIRWLIPRLPGFGDRHPEIRVRLHTSQWDVDFEHEDIDVCIFIGDGSRSDLHYDFLFSSQIFPVCSPSLLQDNKPFDSPDELMRHTLLQVYPSEKDWWTWLEKNGIEGVDPDSGLQFDSYDMALTTAVKGHGIALGIEPFVNHDLEAGLLVEPLPGRRVFTRGDWYLACPKEKAKSEKVSKFRSWMLTEIQSDSSMQKNRNRSDEVTMAPQAAQAV
jgi:LysR family glycine cleavage system transcriptional activator